MRAVHWIVEPGFFSNPEVRTALVIGTLVAVVSAVTGVLTVLRGQAFAGHSLTDASATGASGVALVGITPLAGFVAGAVAGAAAMEAVGGRDRRSHDLSTGVVLGAFIGLASLLLYLDTTSSSASGTPQQILFGSIFTTAPSVLPTVLALAALCLALLAAINRPLLLSSVDPGLASAAGVPVRAVGLLHLLALALAVGLSSLATGAILSTALLIGPAAAALRLTDRFGRAVLGAAALAVASTWVGVLLAYDSADWTADRTGVPASSCIVGTVFVGYLAARLLTAGRWRPRGGR